MANEEPTRVLKALSTVVPPESVQRCPCGSAVFFDWGVKLISTESYGKAPRYQEMAGDANVKICVDCHRAVVVWAGDLYDASEYISAEQVERLIEDAGRRDYVMPARAMDP